MLEANVIDAISADQLCEYQIQGFTYRSNTIQSSPYLTIYSGIYKVHIPYKIFGSQYGIILTDFTEFLIITPQKDLPNIESWGMVVATVTIS